MNQNGFKHDKLSYMEMYSELIKICQNIAQNVEIPTQWIFVYFFSKNWQINDFGDDIKKSQIYKPLETQTSKIYFGDKSINCNLCQRTRKIMIRNMCQHFYCYECLKNYIHTHYSHTDSDKMVFPLCLFFEECSQIVSHEIVSQVLGEEGTLAKQFKKIFVRGFIKNQKYKRIPETTKGGRDY